MDGGTDGGVGRGRAHYRRRAWLDAFTSLSAADLVNPLAPADLELLGMSASTIRRDEDAVRALERAHGGYVESGDVCPAARCAFWVAMLLLNLGEPARANGWFGRAGRLLDGQDCVERAYLCWCRTCTRGSARSLTRSRRSPSRPR